MVSMDRNFLRAGITLFAVTLVLMFSGCGSGGSGNSGSTGTPASSTVSGTVADGYVSGATVSIYSDSEMATQIGSGTTGTDGDFSVTLSVAGVPSTIYVKTTGGIDLATGLPAPTMIFAGSYTAGSLNITPITNQAFIELQANPSFTPDQAFSSVAGKLGISTAIARGDVVADQQAKAAMYDVLSAGNTGTTLPDGTYEVKFLSFLSNDVENTSITGVTAGEGSIAGRVRTFSVTVASGNITGTSDLNEAIEGRAQGTSLTMNMVSASNLNRVAGEISYGAASGTFNQFIIGALPGEAIINGVFIATFTPTNITAQQTAELFNTLANISAGVHYFSTRDVFIQAAAPYTSYGQIAISNMTAGSFDWSGFTNYTVRDNNTYLPAMWENQAGTASFLPGTRIYVIEQDFFAGDNETIYIIGVPGNRKAIGVTHYVDAPARVRSIVEATLVRNTPVAPLIQPETTYDTTVAVAHVGLLTNQRTYNLEIAAFSAGQLVTPAFPGGVNAGYMYFGGENIILAGSTLMMKGCADFSNFSPNDYIMAFEMYEGGAMAGTRVDGGTALEGVPLSAYPSTVAVFLRQDGQTPPDFAGTLNFLSRTMYSLDYSVYREDYASGTITLDTTAGTAVLAATNGIGDAINADLTAEKTLNNGVFTGIVHIYGDLGGDNGFIDIFWPVGSKRATYMTSDGAAGTTFSVGEAYMTF